MKKAWIENDTIRDICHGVPAECYHPDIAVYYDTDVPDEAQNGWIKEGDIWVAPPVPAPPEPPETVEPVTIYPKVSPVEFKLLWTPQERVAISTMKLTDPVIADFYSIIDDPRLTFVNLNLSSTQQAVDYLLNKLAAAGVLTAGQVPARRVDILAGGLQ